MSTKDGHSPPIRRAIPLEQLRGEDAADDDLLRDAADRATRYIRSFEWCAEIHERYFSDGIAGIVALFVFYVSIRKIEQPQWIWVFVGDLPSCYLETDRFPTPRAALLRYIEGVEDYIRIAEGTELETGLASDYRSSGRRICRDAEEPNGCPARNRPPVARRRLAMLD